MYCDNDTIQFKNIDWITFSKKAGFKKALFTGTVMGFVGAFTGSMFELWDYSMNKDFEKKQVIYLAGGYALMGLTVGAIIDEPRISLSFNINKRPQKYK